jgi:integrase/recombinase XerD
MPPPRRPATARILVPHIFSVSELRRLVRKTDLRRRPLSREFSGLTFRTILLFLYGTGSRINEALSLRIEDVDLERGTVRFQQSATSRTRTIPIGPSLRRSLREYSKSLDTSEGGGRRHFFARRNGKPIRPVCLCLSFRTLRRQAGISRSANVSCLPRLQGLRRTFAVHCLSAWLREGKDLRSMLPILGAYLGHASLSSTEAYLSVTLERFVKTLLCLSPKRRDSSTI